MKYILFLLNFYFIYILNIAFFSIDAYIQKDSNNRLILKPNNEESYEISNFNDINIENGYYYVTYYLKDDKVELISYELIKNDNNEILKNEMENNEINKLNSLKSIEINKCNDNNGNCDKNANCIDLNNGIIQCICKDGYIGNGKECHLYEIVEPKCDNKENGFYCFPYNCCTEFYYCVDEKYNNDLHAVPEGLICKDGIIDNNNKCDNVDCNLVKCGDGICQDLESCETCPNDCGKCIECGDGICSKGEDDNCMNDCGIIHLKESQSNIIPTTLQKVEENSDIDTTIELPTTTLQIKTDNIDKPSVKVNNVKSELSCLINNGGCSSNALCSDLKNGVLKCTCKDGYTGNGTHCYEIVSIIPPCSSEIKCYPRNCCNKHTKCIDGKVEIIEEEKGELCYNGLTTYVWDTRCENVDCSISKCGDGICHDDETCLTCPSDCGECIKCGDNICSGGETSESCPIDCGVDKESSDIMDEEAQFNYFTIILICGICIVLLSIVLVLYYSIKIIKTIKNSNRNVTPESSLRVKIPSIAPPSMVSKVKESQQRPGTPINLMEPLNIDSPNTQNRNLNKPSQ